MFNTLTLTQILLEVDPFCKKIDSTTGFVIPISESGLRLEVLTFESFLISNNLIFSLNPGAAGKKSDFLK